MGNGESKKASCSVSEENVLLEWKPEGSEGSKTERWDSFCTKIGSMIRDVPSHDPEEFAVITRTPISEASEGKVIRTTEPKELVEAVVTPNTEFIAKWFVVHNRRIAVLITVMSGEGRGTHFLLGPNRFPEELQNYLNTMRAFEAAANNADA